MHEELQLWVKMDGRWLMHGFYTNVAELPAVLMVLKGSAAYEDARVVRCRVWVCQAGFDFPGG